MSSISSEEMVFDEFTKILIKALTLTNFEFLESFALQFSDMIEQLSEAEKVDKYLNKYFFIIVEKYLLKITEPRPELLSKIRKICLGIIDSYLSKNLHNIRKLFRIAMRIMLIIHHRLEFKEEQTIAFFSEKMEKYIKLPCDDKFIEFKCKVVRDFVEVNFSLLGKKKNMIDFYLYFYNMVMSIGTNFSGESEVKYGKFKQTYLECLEEMIKYELSQPESDLFYEMSYIKLLHAMFNVFLSDGSNQPKKICCIDIICRILKNCKLKMKLKILEEITMSFASIFYVKQNIGLLEILLNTLAGFIKEEGVFNYFEKYFEMLFFHCLKGNYSFCSFQRKLFSMFDIVSGFDSFLLTLNFSKKYLLFLEESTEHFEIDVNKNPEEAKQKLVELNGFLELCAKSSVHLEESNLTNQLKQDILNVYSLFLIFKIINYRDVDFTSKKKLNKLPLKGEEPVNDFVLYLLVFAQNIPTLTFNYRHGNVAPVKVELRYSLINTLEKHNKLIKSEFEDYGDRAKNLIKELSVSNQLYMLCIYFNLLSKIIFLKIVHNSKFSEKKDYIKKKIKLKYVVTVKLSIIEQIRYLTDDTFIHDKVMRELFLNIFNKYKDKYLKHLVLFYNSEFKQALLSRDMIFLLNMSCFYNKEVSELSLGLLAKYLEMFPFILNDYKMFEYYSSVLGVLIKNISEPYKCLIERTEVQGGQFVELPTEKEKMQKILNSLSKRFEKGLQKSYIINNDNISYNLANFTNKINLVEDKGGPVKFSVNIIQKIYNNIKKVEIPTMLKTSAYLEPKKFEAYLEKHVQFDKYLSISSAEEIGNFSDFSKGSAVQLRNKFLGVIEGKIVNLKYNFKDDDRYIRSYIKEKSAKNEVADYCYYKINREYSAKIDLILRKEEITKYDIFSVLLELTAFYIYTEMNPEFRPSFNKQLIFEEIVYKITTLPFLICTADAFEAGAFCWEWILYYNKNKMPYLLNCLKSAVITFKLFADSQNVFKRENSTNPLFSVDRPFDRMKQEKLKEYFESTGKLSYSNVKSFESEVVFTFSRFNFENLRKEDYLRGQITILKFLKECLNVFS